MEHIAILGCGGMGKGHANAIATGNGNPVWAGIPGVPEGKLFETDSDLSHVLTLSGICDIDPAAKAWARERGYYVYESYEEILNDPQVSIVLIATPNHLHKSQAIAAMHAGKHVLCEKPVMCSSEELLEVMAVSKQAGKIFYPRQNRRWDKDFRIIKKIYDERLLGTMFHIECRIQGSRGIPGDWRGKRDCGGGMMLDWGVHLLDRLLTMVPEKVIDVFCELTHITNSEVDDGFRLHLSFESGMTAMMEVGTCHFASLPLWYATGTDGTAVIENWDCDGKMVRLRSWDDKDSQPILAGAGLTKTMAPRCDSSVEVLPLPSVEFDNNELYLNLAQTINGTAEPIISCEHALRVLRLIEVALHSGKTHSVIRFEV